VLTLESEVTKWNMTIALGVVAMMGLCIDPRALPAWGITAILAGSCPTRNRTFAIGPRPARMAIDIQASRKPTHVYPPVLSNCSFIRDRRNSRRLRFIRFLRSSGRVLLRFSPSAWANEYPARVQQRREASVFWQTHPPWTAVVARCTKRRRRYRGRLSKHETYVQIRRASPRIIFDAFSLFLVCKPSAKVSPTKFNAISAGGVAGFLAGLIGTGGAVRGLALAAFNLEKGTFVATSAGIDSGVDFSRMIIISERLSRAKLTHIHRGPIGDRFRWVVPW
jgi:hypothetical protein